MSNDAILTPTTRIGIDKARSKSNKGNTNKRRKQVLPYVAYVSVFFYIPHVALRIFTLFHRVSVKYVGAACRVLKLLFTNIYSIVIQAFDD